MCKELDPSEKELIGQLDWYKHEYYAMCDLYEELEAKTKKLIEKATPKKPKGYQPFTATYYKCPVCNAKIGTNGDYCRRCGQRILWPEKEKKDE